MGFAVQTAFIPIEPPASPQPETTFVELFIHRSLRLSQKSTFGDKKKKKKLNHFDLKVYGNFKLLLKDVFFILKFYFIIETYFFSLFISCLSIIIYYWIATTFHPLPPSPIIIIIYHIYYEVFYIFLFWKIPLLMLIINLNGNLIFSPFNFYIINPFIKV